MADILGKSWQDTTYPNPSYKGEREIIPLSPTKSKRYGFRVNKNNSNSDTRIEYLYDAVGMNPASMSYSSGVFDYGDWGYVWFVKENFPCMLRYDGTVDYKLNPDDYSKKEDGTPSDVANVAYAGNAMSAMPTCWVKQYQIGYYEYFIVCETQYDETYHAYCHQRENGTIMDYRYFNMFEGYFDGTRLRSISGVTVTASQSGSTEMTRIRANGALWESLCWNQVNLIKGLLTLMSKNENSQVKFGNGNANNSVYLDCGQDNNKGQFYGYNTNVNAVKVFHIENWWGNYWKRCRGLINNFGKVMVSNTRPYNETSVGYIDTGIRTVGNSSGWAKDTFSSSFGRLPVNVGGNGSNYIDDYFWWVSSALRYALFGGHRTSGALCGALCVNLNNGFGDVSSFIAASLSCEQPSL